MCIFSICSFIDIEIKEYFTDIETTENYSGYMYSVADAITIAILGSICGLKNVSQIHQWASSEKISKFLKEEFAINAVPCYFWLLTLLKMIKPESLNQCFVKFMEALLPQKKKVISVDGKTIRSTAKMDSYEKPLHIISAQISELKMTLAQKTCSGKSNEIPTVKELLNSLNIKSCLVVADALNCQKETAETIVKNKADYLLCVKDNHRKLKREIEEYINQNINKFETLMIKEKNHGRIEIRTAYVIQDTSWLSKKEDWIKLHTIGAIHREFISKNKQTSEWHFYISSRKLNARKLLDDVRLEWSVETMHWLLDVHFNEDFCRVEDKNVQQNLNIFRKAALNIINNFKSASNSKRSISKVMFDCLLDTDHIKLVLNKN